MGQEVSSGKPVAESRDGATDKTADQPTDGAAGTGPQVPIINVDGLTVRNMVVNIQTLLKGTEELYDRNVVLHRETRRGLDKLNSDLKNFRSQMVDFRAEAVNFRFDMMKCCEEMRKALSNKATTAPLDLRDVRGSTDQRQQDSGPKETDNEPSKFDELYETTPPPANNHGISRPSSAPGRLPSTNQATGTQENQDEDDHVDRDPTQAAGDARTRSPDKNLDNDDAEIADHQVELDEDADIQGALLDSMATSSAPHAAQSPDSSGDSLSSCVTDDDEAEPPKPTETGPTEPTHGDSATAGEHRTKRKNSHWGNYDEGVTETQRAGCDHTDEDIIEDNPDGSKVKRGAAQRALSNILTAFQPRRGSRTPKAAALGGRRGSRKPETIVEEDEEGVEEEEDNDDPPPPPKQKFASPKRKLSESLTRPEESEERPGPDRNDGSENGGKKRKLSNEESNAQPTSTNPPITWPQALEFLITFPEAQLLHFRARHNGDYIAAATRLLQYRGMTWAEWFEEHARAPTSPIQPATEGMFLRQALAVLALLPEAEIHRLRADHGGDDVAAATTVLRDHGVDWHGRFRLSGDNGPAHAEPVQPSPRSPPPPREPPMLNQAQAKNVLATLTEERLRELRHLYGDDVTRAQFHLHEERISYEDLMRTRQQGQDQGQEEDDNDDDDLVEGDAEAEDASSE